MDHRITPNSPLCMTRLFDHFPPVQLWYGQTARDSLDIAGRLGEVVWLSRQIADRFPLEVRLGIIFPTCPELVLIWLAVLQAGKEPCLLQYPTEKASIEYWRDSVENAVHACALEGLVHGSSITALIPDAFARQTFVVDGPFIADDPSNFRITDGHIIQLSSGTTGYRKGIRFSLGELAAHVADYNQVIQLTPKDTIVSWLPLYHDMGFIACFVMPLILGIPLVMIDPVTWIKSPGLLFEAINLHGGTVCYLPNFGFEVLSRQSDLAPVEGMRLWISCSEPSYEPTLVKFCETTRTPASKVATCYAMAENVFAVTLSQGIKSALFEGTSVVSCGRPIPGVELKVVDGEVWVRSQTALRAYVGGESILDADDFYPTGDMGCLDNGELYVFGRKRDIMISAGKKYFLNDLDYTLGKLYPASAGRIASLADFNDRLGTQRALFLLEGGRFWDSEYRRTETSRISNAVGMELFEAHFVPPFFITKTSSGKINRKKTLQDWKAHRAFMESGSSAAGAVADDARFKRRVTDSFASIRLDVPIKEQIDSLGSVVLRLICEDSGIAFDPASTINALADASGQSAPGALDEIVSIVALVDGVKLGSLGGEGYLTSAFIARLERKFGRKVRVEHFAVPPAPILFSDLVFHEYFMPRDQGPKYAAVSLVLGAIRKASLILVDDEDSLRMLDYCAYPRLSFRFINNPQSDLIAHRLATYTRDHHLLARDVVLGGDIDRGTITPMLGQLEQYLDVPIMKLAFHGEFRAYSDSWDYREYRNNLSDAHYSKNPVNAEAIQDAILGFIDRNVGRIRFRRGVPTASLVMKDPAHFCSFLLNAKAVDFAISHFKSFCIAGLPSSAPYIEKRLKLLGKPYFFSGNLSPQREDFDCMLCTGFSGPTYTKRPYFEFMQIGAEGGRPHNLPSGLRSACPPLVECDPKVLEYYLAKVNPTMPIGNTLLNAMRRSSRK